jgi:hypothetical protein
LSTFLRITKGISVGFTTCAVLKKRKWISWCWQMGNRGSWLKPS